MNFPGGNHLCTEISSNQDAFPRRKSSLHRNFFESGCNSLGGIIPAEQFRRIRMNFSAGNHPWRAIPPNQDAFLRRESSLPSNSVESGYIFPAEIISAQKFLRIRMHFSGGNHPCRAILSNQDAFPRRKSSLHRNFFRSGCIPPDGNHLRQAIPPRTGASLTKSGAGLTTTSGTGWG